MEIYAIIGVAIVGSIIAVLIGRYQPEYGIFATLGTGVVLLLLLISGLAPVLQELLALLDMNGLQSGYTSVLLKSLGLCYISQLAADTCCDAGQAAIASKVETAGKVAVLIVSLPLFRELLNIAVKLIYL